MRLLELLNSLFGEVQIQTSVRGIIQEERAKTADDKEFFLLLIQYIGGRGYNNFLDYGLYALKLKELLDPLWFCAAENTSKEPPARHAIDSLMYDDRHDLWQNLPYSIQEIESCLPTEEEKKLFMGNVLDALIECINVRGTGDTMFTSIVKEA
jgi:hypothetical protein